MKTLGTRQVAEIIMQDNKFIFTTYGRKNMEGLIDLINDVTGYEKMLEALEAVMEWARTPQNHGGNPYCMDFVKKARKAIDAARKE